MTRQNSRVQISPAVQLLKPLPIAKSAETAILGAVLKDGSLFGWVRGLVMASDFGREFHGKIFDAFSDLYAKKAVIDTLSVSTWLIREGVLQSPAEDTDAVIHPEIQNIADSVPREISIEEYAKRLKDWSNLRAIINICIDGIEECYDSDQPLDVISAIQRQLLSINLFAVDTITHVSETMDRLEQALSKPRETRRSMVTTTGFNKLDARLEGIAECTINVGVARPKIGKTTMGMQIADHHTMTHPNEAVLYFLLEMDNDMFARRIVQQKSGLQIRRFISGKQDPDAHEIKYLKSKVDEIRQQNIFLIDKNNKKMAEIRAHAYRFRSKHPNLKLGWLIIDHWHLLDTKSGRTEVEGQQNNASELNDLAKELGCRVLILAQCRKPDAHEEKHPPSVNDVKGSGALVEIATNVWIVHRPQRGTGESGALEPCQFLLGATRESAAFAGPIEMSYDPTRLRFID